MSGAFGCVTLSASRGQMLELRSCSLNTTTGDCSEAAIAATAAPRCAMAAQVLELVANSIGALTLSLHWLFAFVRTWLVPIAATLSPPLPE